jgi:hypothetical protein
MNDTNLNIDNIINQSSNNQTGTVLPGKRKQRTAEDIEREQLIEFKKLETEHILRNKEEIVDPENHETICISEVDPDDYGYYSIFHTGWGDNLEMEKINEKEKEAIFTADPKNKKKKYKRIHRFEIFNMSEHMNKVNGKGIRVYRNKIDVVLHYSREDKNNYGDLQLVNPKDVIAAKKAAKDATTKKAVTKQNDKNQTEENGNDDEIIKNTVNSYVTKFQQKFLIENQLQEAVKFNASYILKKNTYVIEIIKKLMRKFNESKKNDSKINIEFKEPFEKLSDDVKGLLESYEKMDSRSPNLKRYLKEYNSLGREYLTFFISDIIKKMTEDNSQAVETTNNRYILWKKKLSELVNIWELFSANGFDIRINFKYLLIKKFLMQRSIAKQKCLILFKPIERKKKLEFNSFSLASSEGNVNFPYMIILGHQFLTTLLDIILGVILAYAIFTIPLRTFLQNDSNLLTTLEKTVDCYFYIDIMFGFRTSYKDKFNNDVYDIKLITNRYIHSIFIIDIITSIPWNYFFIINDFMYSLIHSISQLSKILRATKLLPILARLENLKGANYFRILKLLFIYFIIGHWMGTICVCLISESIKYDNFSEICYKSNVFKTKDNLRNNCEYIISFYVSNFIIPGQYCTYMQAFDSLNPTGEYFVLIISYLIGQIVSAYVFGGVTNIIQNLDQGKNFFTEKNDLLRDHMLFYNINKDVQNDVSVYYDYLWLRHKDIIYGKSRFDLLSISLREKFETMNLIGNEIYLAKFHKLGNPNLIGFILMRLSKIILFPYEILYEEGSLIKGIYVLMNGEIEFTNFKLKKGYSIRKEVEFSKIINELERIKSTSKSNNVLKDILAETSDKCIIFPLEAAFLKTGRTHLRCFGHDFADLLYLQLSNFEDIIQSFPIEMHSLKHSVMHEVEKEKIYDPPEVFQMISKHSARSVGKYFEKKYDKMTIWIPIPIPISQRKIDKNFIESFIKKVKNQYKEIIVGADLNICLNSIKILSIIGSSKGKQNADDKNNENEEENQVVQSNGFDQVKMLAKNLGDLLSDIIKREENN